jgi:hypothetical protein
MTPKVALYWDSGKENLKSECAVFNIARFFINRKKRIFIDLMREEI